MGAYAELDSLIALQAKARGFSLLHTQPAHSLLYGRRASHVRGRGLDFEELREYVAGDDVRSIDWRVTARTTKPYFRVYSEERDRPTMLVVDQLGGLMTAVELLRPLAKIAADAQVAIEPYPSKSDRFQAAIARLMGTSNDTQNAASLTRLLRLAGPLLSALDVATNPAADERLRAPLP